MLLEVRTMVTLEEVERINNQKEVLEDSGDSRCFSS